MPKRMVIDASHPEETRVVVLDGSRVEEFDFESAAEWRDKLATIESFRKKNEWILWLDDATDNWEIERKDGEIFVFLVTMRARKNMGKRIFVFKNKFSDEEVFEEILPEFYRLHAPAEIRVSRDFPAER